MATFTCVTDIWTQGYDQFYRPCWQNKKTREIYYESSGQVPAQPYVSFGYAADSNLPTGPDFTAAVGSRLEGFPLWFSPPLWQAIFPPPIGICIAQGKENGAVGSFTPAADMWTYGFDQFDRPCWLNKKTRKFHYDSVKGQPPAQPPRVLFTPTASSPQSGPYFVPAFASCVEDLPPPKAGGNKIDDEDGQWYLQRNEKGEEYYLNTTTWQWQYETPDCLEKPTRGKWLPGCHSSNKG